MIPSSSPASSFRVLLYAVILLSANCPTFAKDPDQRRFAATELFINNHQFGDDNGCSSDVATKGTSTCGHAGHVSEVTWAYVRTSAEGDIYEVTRKYPSDSSTPKTETRQITYTGQPVTLWHDSYQNIILRPKLAA